MQKLAEAHDLVIKVNPVIHLAKLHIAHRVVHRGKPGALRFVLDGSIGGCKSAFVIGTIYEDMQRFTVRVNRRSVIKAMIVFFFARSPSRLAAACGCFLPCFFNVVHFQRDHFHTITMQQMMRREWAGWSIRCRNNKPRLPRFQHIRSKVAVASFKPGIGNGLETECLPPVIHGMFGIAHIEVDMIDGFDL